MLFLPRSLVAAASCLALVQANGPPSYGGHPPPPPPSYPQHKQLGAVASEASECTEIGVATLRRGGNAADALVATQLCVGVVSMYHSGIGGGGFMLVRAPNGTYEFIDFREVAPGAATQDMYNNNVEASLYGGLAAGVPGDLRGLERLHKGYGRLPWPSLVLPAARLARNGFKVNADTVKYIKAGLAEVKTNFLVDDPAWSVDFAPNGTIVGLGDTLTRKRYATTLETIAAQGVDAFYHGHIANTTIAAIKAKGGIMTLEDLKNYSVAIRAPSELKYRDYKLTATSAPSGGVVTLAAMNILSGYTDLGDPAALNRTQQRIDEAMRFAYGERANLGDPAFTAGIKSYQADMLNPGTGAEIRTKITNRAHNVSYYDPSGLESFRDHGTSYMAVADAEGMAISVTTTVNTYFGSKVCVPETGIILNNEMNDFSIPGSSNAFGYIPSEVNFIKPGKRPLSSISPVIVEHAATNSLYFVVGSAGGSRIITATILNLWHVLDQKLTSAQALARPRFHDQLTPVTSSFEYAYDNATTAYFKSAGYNVTWVAPGGSTAQALRVLPNGTFEPASEPRQLNSLGKVAIS